MNSQAVLSAETIHQYLLVLVDPGSVTELRIPRTSKGTQSGYFDDPATLSQIAAAWSGRASGLYITLNAVRRDLLARAANRVVAHARNTTKDEDIVRRRWCPIDFDAVRPAGISATDGEHQAALDRARQCRDWLCEQGWPEPVFADSGNGAHLLYRIELPNDGPSCELLKHGLEALAFQFGDGSVVVDQATYNASRVWKLYGTLAAKGENLAERPHRLAKLLEVPEQLEVVSPAILEGLAAKLPEAPKTRARPRGDFDLPSWIAEHKLPVVAEAPWSGGHKWVLSPCPWDAGHADRAAYIVQLSNGAIAAGCHHTGCAERDWPALRDLVEPGWGEQAGEREAGSAGECDERPTQAELLVTLGADADVFHSPEGDPYATVPVEEHRETWAVKERPFRLWLVRRFFNRTGRAPNAQALQDALGVFECRARFDGPRHQVFVRVGGLDDTIYLDLANERWEAVEIGPFGWRIISDPPVKFRRTRGMEALPCPVTGGSLAELRPFLNLVGDADWYLLYSVASVHISPARPISSAHHSRRTGVCKKHDRQSVARNGGPEHFPVAGRTA